MGFTNYTGIYWDAPPSILLHLDIFGSTPPPARMPVANKGLGRDSLLKLKQNPGGAGGPDPRYIVKTMDFG